MAVSFEKDTWVWCPDEEDLFLPGKVQTSFKRGEQGEVVFSNGEEHTISEKESAKLTVCDIQSLEPIENMVQLNDLNDASILHNLRIRFQQDSIYTSVGQILVSVNPFKLLPIYTPEWLDKYKGGSRGQPPHVYGVADDAYRQMIANADNHAIIISGESGAGKTEAMKLVLQYVAEVSGKRETEGPSLEEQILKANPVMEAFGNAKTVRNNNSSRFGKWTAVKFDKGGAIIGGKIVNYLLEKSRVVSQSENERNYHVFYQLFAGAEKSKHESGAGKTNWKTLLGVGEAQDYLYTNPENRLEASKGVGTQVKGINDEREFEDLLNAMKVIQMDDGEIENVLKIVAGILNLGNVRYVPDPSAAGEEKVKIDNKDSLQKFCSLLQVDEIPMERCLTSRGIGAHSVIQVSYKLDEATQSRDALAKTIYGNLFDWLVGKINTTLAASTDEKAVSTIIGVLDIFGFESFEKNSFEQLCINYCNEKLQFHFNEHIFKLEQEQYKNEGVSVDNITFVDNQPALDLIEKKREGIIAMIDEEIRTPKGSDLKMLSKLNKAHGTKGKEHINYKMPRPRAKDSDRSFIFLHYAGPVTYDVTGFMEKSKDTLHADIAAVMQTSKDNLLRTLFPLPTPAAPSTGRRRGGGKGASKKTLGTQFKTQLNELMITLNSTSPHFIRCFKPNKEKVGNIFTADMMLQQLQYAGLLEVCRIRQVGFPIRYDFDTFLNRYSCLMHGKTSDLDGLLKELCHNKTLDNTQYAKGNTKVFLRNEQAQKLEIGRETALSAVATRMAAMARRFLQRIRSARYSNILASLEKAKSSRDGKEIEHWLVQAGELPFRGVHLKIVRECTALLEVIQEERRVETLLTNAISAREINGLLGAIKTAKDMGMRSSALTEAQSLVGRIQEEAKLKSSLSKAVKDRNRNDLETFSAKAQELDLNETAEYKQAVALLERIRLEEDAVGHLQGAIESKNTNELNAYLQQMVEMGLDDSGRFPQFSKTIAEAKKLLGNLKAKVAAAQALAKACESRDMSALERSIANCKSLGVAASNISKGQSVYDAVKIEQQTVKLLNDAIAKEDLKLLAQALAKAKQLNLQDDAIGRAETQKSQIEARQEATVALKAAVSSGNAASISAALSRACQLGCNKGDIETAEKALSKLGAASKLLGKLAAAGNSLIDLDKAIDEATGAGGLEDAIASAKVTRARLVLQGEAEAQIAGTIKSQDYEGLKAAMADAETCGLTTNPLKTEVIVNATSELQRLGEIASSLADLLAACTARDKNAIMALLKTVKAKGVTDDAPECNRAQGVLSALEEEAKLTEKIEAALKAKDNKSLKQLWNEANKVGLSNNTVQAAGMIINREATIKKTLDKMKAAETNWNLDEMNEALETCIQLGIEGEEVEHAKSILDEMKKEGLLASKIQAAANTLTMKSNSKNGIGESDIEPLIKAMDEAVSSGLSKTSKSYTKFEKMKNNALEQIELYSEINDVIATLDDRSSDASVEDKFKLASKTLNKALDLGMEGVASVITLKALFREYDRLVQDARRERNEASDDDESESDEDEEDEEEVERKRIAAQERAKQPRFEFFKYSRIRSREDYVRGMWFGKQKAMDMQLRHQTSTIRKSLSDLPDKLSRQAIKIHKCILGYCGEKSMNYPDMLARDVLMTGINASELWDEIYIQICKHLTQNPNHDSREKAWQLMCMCTGTFPPTAEFKDYILNFLLTYEDESVAEYQQYSIRRLEGMIEQGASGYIPSVAEIKAYHDRPPIVATIELVDGSTLTTNLPITPDLDVKQVSEICNHFLSIEDNRKSHFGIFLVDEGNAKGKLTTPLSEKVFMGDEVMKLRRAGNSDYKFVYKRKIFLEGPIKSECEAFNRLNFLQAVDDMITGYYDTEDVSEATQVVSYSIYIDNCDDLEGEEIDESTLIDDLAMMEYVPLAFREQMTENEWATCVLASLNRLRDAEADADQLQDEILNIAVKDLCFGSVSFPVECISMDDKHAPSYMRSIPTHAVLLFDRNGLRFRSGEAGAAKKVLATFGYVDICRWGGTANKFSLQLWNAGTEQAFSCMYRTPQGTAISNYLLDMINAIMEEQE